MRDHVPEDGRRSLFAQPIIELIAPDVGNGDRLACLMVTFSLVGYRFGLLLVVLLADIVENRRLILASPFATAAVLAGLALAPTAAMFSDCRRWWGRRRGSVQLALRPRPLHCITYARP